MYFYISPLCSKRKTTCIGCKRIQVFEGECKICLDIRIESRISFIILACSTRSEDKKFKTKLRVAERVVFLEKIVEVLRNQIEQDCFQRKEKEKSILRLKRIWIVSSNFYFPAGLTEAD